MVIACRGTLHVLQVHITSQQDFSLAILIHITDSDGFDNGTTIGIPSFVRHVCQTGTIPANHPDIPAWVVFILAHPANKSLG